MRKYSAFVIEHVSPVPVPLNEMKTGKIAQIVSITAGQGLRGRLYAMGLAIGESIEVLQNDRHGPAIVAVCGCRIVLGRGMAGKILVE